MTHLSRPVAVAFVSTVLALAAGCGPVRAGAAAVVGNVRITAQDVRSSADQLTAQSPTVARSQAVTATINYLVQYALVDELARRQTPPVSVSDAEVTAYRSALVQQGGSADALDKAFLERQVPRSGEQSFLRSILQRDKIGAALVPGTGDAVAQQRQAAVAAAAAAVAKDLKIRVNPRFGSFDPKTFAVSPLPSGGLATAASPAPAESAPAAAPAG